MMDAFMQLVPQIALNLEWQIPKRLENVINILSIFNRFFKIIGL